VQHVLSETAITVSPSAPACAQLADGPRRWSARRARRASTARCLAAHHVSFDDTESGQSSHGRACTIIHHSRHASRRPAGPGPGHIHGGRAGVVRCPRPACCGCATAPCRSPAAALANSPRHIGRCFYRCSMTISTPRLIVRTCWLDVNRGCCADRAVASMATASQCCSPRAMHGRGPCLRGRLPCPTVLPLATVTLTCSEPDSGHGIANGWRGPCPGGAVGGAQCAGHPAGWLHTVLMCDVPRLPSDVAFARCYHQGWSLAPHAVPGSVRDLFRRGVTLPVLVPRLDGGRPYEFPGRVADSFHDIRGCRRVLHGGATS